MQYWKSFIVCVCAEWCWSLLSKVCVYSVNMSRNTSLVTSSIFSVTAHENEHIQTVVVTCVYWSNTELTQKPLPSFFVFASWPGKFFLIYSWCHHVTHLSGRLHCPEADNKKTMQWVCCPHTWTDTCMALVLHVNSLYSAAYFKEHGGPKRVPWAKFECINKLIEFLNV